MPIWVSRMTDNLAQNRGTHAVHSLCTVRAPIVCFALMLGAGAAQAETAWDMFVARCLDPYEHLTLAITEGLRAQPIDQMHEDRKVYGPTPEGFLLILDEAPSDGVRTCAVELAGKEMTDAEADWREAQVSEGLYVVDGDWLVSHDWITPGIKMRTEATDARTIYSVAETDLGN